MKADIRAVLLAIANDGSMFIAVAEAVGPATLKRLCKQVKKQSK